MIFVLFNITFYPMTGDGFSNFMMRKNLLILACMALAACTREESAPDFVEDYSPRLLQSAGTKLDGNWFPLVPGVCRGYAGRDNATIQSGLNGQPETPVALDTTIVAYNRVLAPIPLVLPTGTITVFPIEEAIGAQGWKRYFTRDGGAVQIRAIQRQGSEPVEVLHPVYLKEKLVVGDSWETEPEVDMNRLVGELGKSTSGPAPQIELKLKCRFFVLGEETVIIAGAPRTAMAVQQRAQAIGTIRIEPEVGKLLVANVNLTLDGTLHFERDSGLVRQGMETFAQFSGTIEQAASLYSPHLVDHFTLDLKDLSRLEFESTSPACSDTGALQPSPKVSASTSATALLGLLSRRLEQALTE